VGALVQEVGGHKGRPYDGHAFKQCVGFNFRINHISRLLFSALDRRAASLYNQRSLTGC